MTADEQKAHAARLMAPELLHSIRVPHPRAILTGGQPGSGKSRIVNSVGIEFEGLGGSVVIDPDAIRPTLPYMKERIAAGILGVPDAANIDAGTIAYQMVQIAKTEGRNLIVDGTLQNTTRALALAGELRAAAYSVEFHGMAVSPELSHARTYTRREDQIANSPTGFGRGVGDEFHFQAVKGYATTVDAFQTKAAVDSMALYYGDGAKVETKFEVGAWVPAISMTQTLEKAHMQPSIEAIKVTSETWQVASDAMRARQAPADEQAKVDEFLAIASAKAASLTPTHIEASKETNVALDPLTRREFAEADRTAVQDRAMDAALNDTERLLSEYTADDQSFGGRYVNSDLMKERFPDFTADREARGRYNMAVHNSAAVLASEQFKRAVADIGDGSRTEALFITGVPGAGKSFSVQNRTGGTGVPADMRVLYEGQLANPAVAIDKVRTAVDAGLKTAIIAVLPRVEDAFDRTLGRFKQVGRGAGIDAMANIHEGLPNGLRALDREFGDKVAILVHDVRDTTAHRMLNLQDGLEAWQEELEHGPVRDRLNARLEQLGIDGRADENFARQARGEAPFPEHRSVERSSLEGGREGPQGPGVRSGSGPEALLEPAQAEAAPSPQDGPMHPYTIASLEAFQASGSRVLSAHLTMDWEAQTGLTAPPCAIGVEGGVILPAYNRDGLAGGVFCDTDRKAFAIEEEYQPGLFIPWTGIDELARCETLCVANGEREAAAIARAAGSDVGVVLARNQVVEAVEEVRFRFPSTPIIVTAHMGMDRAGQTERLVEQGCVFAGIAAGERAFDELPQEEARETLRTACDQAIGAGENTLAAQAGTIAAGESITVQAPAIEEVVERESQFPLLTTPTEHIEMSRSDRGRDISRERDDGLEM